MKFSVPIFCLLAAALGAAPLFAQIGSPEERQAILERARTLIDPDVRPLEELTNGIVRHPFHSRVDVMDEGPAAGATLARIAEGLSVDGAIEMGGVRYLLFQGRRVGPGDYLPVEYGGRTYQVEVAEITASSFTLRLNDEEIERNL